MDWKSLLSTVAPWIGTAIGGPLGGMAVTAVGNALGLDKATESSLKQALSGVTPEQMLALKQADNDFALKMQQLGFSDLEALEKIAADDRASARVMQTSTRSRMPAIITMFLSVLEAVVMLGKMAGYLHVTDPDTAQMIGALNTVWIASISFWVGTTHDSGRKTELLAQGAANGN